MMDVSLFFALWKNTTLVLREKSSDSHLNGMEANPTTTDETHYLWIFTSRVFLFDFG